MITPKPTIGRLCGALVLSVVVAAANAAPPPLAPLPKVRLEPVIEAAFFSPVAIANAGDGSGRLFVVEQRGTVQVIVDGVLSPMPFLDISGKLVDERRGFDERGLLSIAFHPDFATPDSPGEGKFYVYYSAPSPNAPGSDADPVNHMSVVAEYSTSPDGATAEPQSERVLLTVDQPQFNHDGGQLAFGPDRMLYIAIGDGGGADDNEAGHTGGNEEKPDGVLGNSQDLTKLLGKILRIDPLGKESPEDEYGIPEGNPFAGGENGGRAEIWAYGLRNPWRFSFDRGGSNQLFCADVGQGDVEEVNIIEAGGNYGWRRFEGEFDFDPSAPTTGDSFVAPIGQYAHPGSDLPGVPNVGTSITGGYVYRGSQSPGLQGAYLFGDWTNSFVNPAGTLLALTPGGSPGSWELGSLDVEGGNPIGMFVPTFGEDEAGEVYVAGKTTLAPSAGDPDTGEPTGGVFKIVEIAASGGGPGLATIGAVADTSLYEEPEPLANGAGRFLFSGHTASLNDGLERRALLKFDIGKAVPAGSTIDEVTVSLTMNKVPRSGAQPASSSFGLHRVTRNWGEGSVNAPSNEGRGATATDGSATWISTAFNTGPDWAEAGGDFVKAASASIIIDTALQRYSWSTGQLGTDVQNWLDSPDDNFGWMLLSDSDDLATARRFASREAPTESDRPALEIAYSAPAVLPSYREAWLEQFYPSDDYPGDFSNEDGDSLLALIEYSAGTDPTLFDRGLQAISAAVDDKNDLIISFRRDPRATDLTYLVELSTDLAIWDVIATSEAGAPTIGTAGGEVVEKNLLGEYPVKAVTIGLPFDIVATPRLLVRLTVIRDEP